MPMTRAGLVEDEYRPISGSAKGMTINEIQRTADDLPKAD
jgi:hypothetical protein